MNDQWVFSLFVNDHWAEGNLLYSLEDAIRVFSNVRGNYTSPLRIVNVHTQEAIYLDAF